MNKPNQETKTKPKDRACRTLRRSAKKGLVLLLVAVFLVTTAVSGSFTGTDAATSTTKAKSTWVMSKSNKCSYYVNKKGKKVAKFVKKSGKWYYYTYNTKKKKWTKWTKTGKWKGKTNSIQKLYGKYFYVNKDGSIRLKKGWKKVSKKQSIYIGTNGNVIVKYYKKSGKWYYAEWRRVEDVTADEITAEDKFVVVKQEIRTLSDGKVYYFGKTGAKATKKGWKELSAVSDGTEAYVNAKGVVTKIKDANGDTTKPDAKTPEKSIEDAEAEETSEETGDVMTMADGTVLDLTYFPETVTEELHYRYVSYDDGKTLTKKYYYDLDYPRIYSTRDLDPSDITFVINEGNVELVWDLNSPDLHFDSAGDNYYSTSGYDVPGWKNRISYVETVYHDMLYDYGHGRYYLGVTIGRNENAGSFTISAYYKDGTFLRTCTVTTISTNASYRTLVDEIESKAWTEEFLAGVKSRIENSNAIIPDEYAFMYDFDDPVDGEKVLKLQAIGSYVLQNYSYSEIDCQAGATILYFAAKDLGLAVKYRHTKNLETGENGDPEYWNDGHGQDSYDCYGAGAIGGHVIIVITLDSGKIFKDSLTGAPSF